MTRKELQVTNITKLPSGRGIVTDCGGITLLNIYAPSGTARSVERENFFNTKLAYLLRNVPDNFFLGGDVNCLVQSADTTSHCTHRRALAELVQGFALKDVWKQPSTWRVYTHYLPTGATHIDLFYATTDLYERKIF